MNKEILLDNGINFGRGIERCGGDEKLYEDVMSYFLRKGSNYRDVAGAYRDDDYPAVYTFIHDVKGSCGNLEISGLYLVCCKILEKIKLECYDEIAPMLFEYDEEYSRTLSVIEKALAE